MFGGGVEQEISQATSWLLRCESHYVSRETYIELIDSIVNFLLKVHKKIRPEESPEC